MHLDWISMKIQLTEKAKFWASLWRVKIFTLGRVFMSPTLLWHNCHIGAIMSVKESGLDFTMTSQTYKFEFSYIWTVKIWVELSPSFNLSFLGFLFLRNLEAWSLCFTKGKVLLVNDLPLIVFMLKNYSFTYMMALMAFFWLLEILSIENASHISV